MNKKGQIVRVLLGLVCFGMMLAASFFKILQEAGQSTELTGLEGFFFSYIGFWVMMFFLIACAAVVYLVGQ